MLYPKINKHREVIDLSGFWNIQFDYIEEGIDKNWQNGIEESQPIAVPASWNEQFAEDRDFLGPAWYQTTFDIPERWNQTQVRLRFGSVNYIAEVWLNGKILGNHEGGHLPFEFDINDLIQNECNTLVVRVDGRLLKEHVPPQGREMNFPETNFDFFPYCGIHRPVLLYSIPHNGIKDITVNTEIDGNNGKVNVKIDKDNSSNAKVRVSINGHGSSIKSEVTDNEELTLLVKDAALWSPESPNLYEMDVELLKENEEVYDSYSLSIGIRTIEVRGNKLLLNGKPIYLTGFGRHEDFPIVGKGYLPALIIKDYSLLKWIGANSFRTSHYPYSEQMMDLADRLGFLIIDETPAVGLTFRAAVVEKHLELCTQYIQDLIKRDKNHPSVIMWSLANEPHRSAKAKKFFHQMYEVAREIDTSRPITVVSMIGEGEKAFEFLDVVCLNRYNGWYTQTGRIDEGVKLLSEEIDKVYEKYPKPFILSEFGTDTLPGCHAQPPEMWSEEYQVEFLRKYTDLLKTKDFVVGEHIWNMCDFKTSQGILRAAGMNHKGVFTRDRRPKMAAHFLKELWTKKE